MALERWLIDTPWLLEPPKAIQQNPSRWEHGGWMDVPVRIEEASYFRTRCKQRMGMGTWLEACHVGEMASRQGSQCFTLPLRLPLSQSRGVGGYLYSNRSKPGSLPSSVQMERLNLYLMGSMALSEPFSSHFLWKPDAGRTGAGCLREGL